MWPQGSVLTAVAAGLSSHNGVFAHKIELKTALEWGDMGDKPKDFEKKKEKKTFHPVSLVK